MWKCVCACVCLCVISNGTKSTLVYNVRSSIFSHQIYKNTFIFIRNNVKNSLQFSFAHQRCERVDGVLNTGIYTGEKNYFLFVRHWTKRAQRTGNSQWTQHWQRRMKWDRADKPKLNSFVAAQERELSKQASYCLAKIIYTLYHQRERESRRRKKKHKRRKNIVPLANLVHVIATLAW